MATVGILGGGQLGLMLAESLDRLGQGVVVLEPDPESPCAQRRSHVIAAKLTDPTALADFFARVDIATFDSENTPSGPLQPYAAKLAPSLRVLEVSQDRAKEKTFLSTHGFRPVSFRVVAPGEDVRAAALSFGLPCIAKSALGGYDGKGWPFGHPLLLGDVHARLQRIPGLAYVDVVRLVPVDVVSGARGTPGDKVQAGPRDLLFCVGNEIEIVT